MKNCINSTWKQKSYPASAWPIFINVHWQSNKQPITVHKFCTFPPFSFPKNLMHWVFKKLGNLWTKINKVVQIQVFVKRLPQIADLLGLVLTIISCGNCLWNQFIFFQRQVHIYRNRLQYFCGWSKVHSKVQTYGPRSNIPHNYRINITYLSFQTVQQNYFPLH